MRKLSLLSIAASFLILFIACQSSQSTSETALEEELSEFGKEVDKVLPNLESPAEIAMFIEMTGAEYVGDLVADTANLPNFIGDPDLAALNLGIFTSDLAYTTTFKQSEQSLATLKACQLLANDLGIGYTYLSAILNYYSAEIKDEDSLVMFLESETGLVRENFVNSDRQRLYTAFVGGFIIENLHLVTGIIDTYPDDLLPADAKALVLREMIMVVLESEKNLANLITMIEEVLTPEDPGVLIDELKDLKASLDKVDFKEIATIENPADILKNEVLLEVTEKVALIRADIVNAYLGE